jgi:WD40 repeat protein
LTAKNADLKVFNIEIDLPFRIINKPVTPFVLSKDSTLKIEIEYVPTDTAYKYGQVRIQSDLCNETILHLAGGSVFSPNFVETLKILQPNGGETLFAGGYYDIKWRGILPIDEVTIDHSFDNGNFWNTIGIGDQMNFRWNPVTNRISNLNKIRLRHTSKEGSTKKIVSLNGLNNRVVSLKWNNHATQLFTAGQDGFIRIWDPVQADPLRTIASGLFKIIDMDLSYDDQYLAHISSDDSLIHIINLDDNLTTTTFSYNNELISKLDWHPTEHQLLAATESGKIILIDAISQSFIKVYTPDNSRANDAKWSPKGDLIVAGYSSGNIAICYLADDSVAVLKNSDARVNSVSINASGMTISVASDLETITIWNLTTQSIVLNMQNHSKNVKITSWDPKLKFVATTSLDSTISLWEPSTGTVKHRFSYHNNVVSAFEWSNDGKKIASGTIEGEVLIWSPDDLPFENQFTQIDISDNTFSIIMPNIETSELDFGNLYYKDRVDSSFVKNIVFNNVLINRNFQTIRIDSISVKYNTNPVDAFKATYRFINYFPIELAKDENLELIAQLKTTYKNIKRKSDTLLYYTNAGIFKSIIRYGIGKQILLNISDNIDFGKVPLGDSAALAVRIRNLSNEFDYTINSIADFIPETNDFDFSELIGTKILKNNSKDINLKFLPKETGKTSKLLVCEVIENNELLENLTYDIELYGEGIAPKIAFSGFMDKIEVLCDDSIGRKEMFIYNIGNHELQIRNITIEDNPNNKFQLDLSATNFLVPAGDSTSFIITYESLDIGFDQALIVVETNITKEWKTIHKKNILAKRELSEFEFSQNKLRFLVDDINSSQTRTFQIRNTGTIPIFWSLPESSDLFVVENIFPMNTLPDDSSEVTVKFLGSQSLGYFDSKFDFRDTCHNIQSLIVDAYVGPNSAKIKIPEFLNLPDLICEKQSPEYTIEITNTGATPLFIDNIYFTNGDFVDFEIVNFPASDRIDAGKTGIVKFVFAPQTPGIKKSYLAIESNATNSIEGKNLIEINAFAGHIEIELTPSQIFFESLIQNKEYQETTIANNKSNIPIFWQYPIESTHFSIDSIIPKMTAPGESSVIFVTFKGGTTGNTYSEIFEFELPCDYELALELFADVQRLASTGIKAGFITAKPGDTVMLPLYLYSPSDVGLPQTLGYKTQLKFNSKIMYPLTENKGVLEGNYRILDIDLPANPIDGETAIEIPFLATLGDTIDTEIRIQNSIAISSEEITIEEVSGYFSLDSLCIEGGVRLIANTGRFNLLQNYPNPADETTTFKFSAIERGIHKLVIVDINGAHVATVFETELQAGTFEVNFSVSKFAIGNYIYRLIGPNLELNKKMTILR